MEVCPWWTCKLECPFTFGKAAVSFPDNERSIVIVVLMPLGFY